MTICRDANGFPCLLLVRTAQVGQRWRLRASLSRYLLRSSGPAHPHTATRTHCARRSPHDSCSCSDRPLPLGIRGILTPHASGATKQKGQLVKRLSVSLVSRPVDTRDRCSDCVHARPCFVLANGPSIYFLIGPTPRRDSRVSGWPVGPFRRARNLDGDLKGSKIFLNPRMVADGERAVSIVQDARGRSWQVLHATPPPTRPYDPCRPTIGTRADSGLACMPPP